MSENDSTDCHSIEAAHYADRALWAGVEIESNRQVAAMTFRLRFRAAAIAERIRPGQFLMLRIAGTDDPLIGRPLAMYDVDGDAIDVVYAVLGNLTSRLATLGRHATLEVWGPLGNGFVPADVDHLVMVAGGIGHTPFLAVAKQHLGLEGYGDESPRRYADRVTLCYGARSSNVLSGIDDFSSAGVAMHVATDDGSLGHHGLVTDLLPDLLVQGEARIVCCGPEPMMAAVSKVAAQQDVACQVSLETPMACGIGICFSCVARVQDARGEWDYKRTCVDGPVFDAEKIVW